MIKDTYITNEKHPEKNIVYKHAIFDFDTSISALGKERQNETDVSAGGGTT